MNRRNLVKLGLMQLPHHRRFPHLQIALYMLMLTESKSGPAPHHYKIVFIFLLTIELFKLGEHVQDLISRCLDIDFCSYANA